jgi:hypothetical protein
MKALGIIAMLAFALFAWQFAQDHEVVKQNEGGRAEPQAAERERQAEYVKACSQFVSGMKQNGVRRDLAHDRVFVDWRFSAVRFSDQEQLARNFECDVPAFAQRPFVILDGSTGRRIGKFKDNVLTIE